MHRSTILAAAASLSMSAGILTAGAVVSPSLAYKAPSAASTCMEDAPCWTWSKMGDRRRGVTAYVRGGTERRVVGPCAFARLYWSGRLAPHTASLRGDWWAIANGCTPSRSAAKPGR